MRSLRAENLKLVNEVSQLNEKNAEARRKAAIAESSENALKAQLKSADSAVRRLKEEVARTKALVAQTRSTCANDVRRRDRQIDTLKKQLGEAGRARGSRTNPAITTINVTGNFGAEKETPSGRSSTTADDYSLRSETNAFLAKLAQDLGEENEAILVTMRNTVDRLRQMSGWDNGAGDGSSVVKQPGWGDVSTELEAVMDHMKTILTNPSFVPIEEVEMREEEINRLKDGWVKMESRWREAVHLIDGWRKRMAASGKPVCDEELQMGLRLSPVRIGDAEGSGRGRLFHLSAVEEEEVEEMEDVQPSPSPSAEEPPNLEPEEHSSELELEAPREDVKRVSGIYKKAVAHEEPASPQPGSFSDSSPLPEPPQISPLRNSPSAGNRGTGARRGLASLRAATDERPNKDLSRDGKSQGTTTRSVRFERPRSPSRTSLDAALLSGPKDNKSVDEEEGDEEGDDKPVDNYDSDDDELASGPPQKTPRTGASKLPVPRNGDGATQQQSPLTMARIAAKLAASEREAEAARVRGKLQSFRGAKRPTIAQPQPEQSEAPAPAPPPPQEEESEDVDPVKRDPAEQAQQVRPEKRKRDRQTGKAASRRRSTLSPWELDSLISGKVQQQ